MTKFNIGDRVRLSVLASAPRRADIGDMRGTVSELNDWGARVDWDTPNREWNGPEYHEIELVPARRIPVGTRVRVISREPYAGAYFGREGVVNRDDGTSIVPYCVFFGGETARALFDYDDLEVITVPNPAAQFNIGDRVRFSRHASSARRSAVGTREGVIRRFSPSTGYPVVRWQPYEIPSYNSPPFDEIELVDPPTPDAFDLRAVANEKRRRVTELRDQANALTEQASTIFRQASDLVTEADTIERAAAIIEASK